MEETKQRIGVSWRTTPEFKAKLDLAVAATGRSLMQEIELRLMRSIDGDDGLGGPRTAHLLRTFVTLIGNRDDTWLDDINLFNVVRDAWNKHLDAIKPERSPEEQAEHEAEYLELKRAIEEATPERKRGFRGIARFLAETGTTLDLEMRARYAALAECEAEEA